MGGWRWGGIHGPGNPEQRPGCESSQGVTLAVFWTETASWGVAGDEARKAGLARLLETASKTGVVGQGVGPSGQQLHPKNTGCPQAPC